jgi:hypothetical protein
MANNPPSSPTVARDPLAELLADAANRTTDPVVRAWLRRLLEHGEEAAGQETGERRVTLNDGTTHKGG